MGDSDDPCIIDTPSLCTSSGSKVGNFFSNLGSNLYNLLGMSDFIDPFNNPSDKVNKDIQNTKDCTQNVINKSVEVFAQEQVKLDDDLLKLISTSNTMLQNFVGWQDEMLREKITLNTVYIAGSYVLILITIFFLLASNAFKK